MHTKSRNLLQLLVSAAMLLVWTTAAHATALSADPSYKAGFDAGFKAAMEALKAGAAAPKMEALKAGAAPPKSEEPSDWWNHSALMYEKLDSNWRHHAEIQFSGSSLRGNDDGLAIRGSVKFLSRRNQWTNEIIGSMDRRSISQPSGSINKRDYRMFQDSVRYDLTRQLYVSGGYIWETDDISYIDNRNTGLAGIGFYVVDNPTIRLNTFIGAGRLNETYLSDITTFTGAKQRSSGLLYFYQSLDWQISENWSLQQGFRQIRDLSASGHYDINPAYAQTSNPVSFPYAPVAMVKRYRNVSNVSLNYKLSPRSSVTLGVEQRHDSNPWPDVLPTDTTKRLSLNVLF